MKQTRNITKWWIPPHTAKVTWPLTSSADQRAQTTLLLLSSLQPWEIMWPDQLHHHQCLWEIMWLATPVIQANPTSPAAALATGLYTLSVYKVLRDQMNNCMKLFGNPINHSEVMKLKDNLAQWPVTSSPDLDPMLQGHILLNVTHRLGVMNKCMQLF